MAKYQKYSSYQEDQNQDNIFPSHWIKKKLKWELLAKSGVDQKNEFGKYDLYGANGIIGKTSTCLDSELLPLVLIGRVGSAGVINYLTSKAGVSDNALIVQNVTYKTPRFDFYLLMSLKLDEIVSKNAQPLITSSNIRDLNVYVPIETSEREAIANFLDHETAKIDSLIAKQEKLIELLKEKRQAVISHAVTRGLNPDVNMKDSGVEWLGQVPEHWVVSLIKYQCKEITDGAHISPDLENGEHYFVSIRDIKEGVINFDDALLTSDKSYQYLVHTGCKPFAGDILFSKDGTIGQTAITPSDIDFVVASSLIIIRPKYSKVTSEFLDLLLRSDIVQEQVESFVKGAALRRLSIQNLLKIWGVFPPIDEQEMIVEFVLSQLDKYKDLEFKAVKQVELLKERRTALISSAVTGKIDVRNWQERACKNNNEVYLELSA